MVELVLLYVVGPVFVTVGWVYVVRIWFRRYDISQDGRVAFGAEAAAQVNSFIGPGVLGTTAGLICAYCSDPHVLAGHPFSGPVAEIAAWAMIVLFVLTASLYFFQRPRFLVPPAFRSGRRRR